MATITVEVPDELAAQVAALRGRLPDLLASALKAESAGKQERASKAEADAPLYREITDFLASAPAPERIISFKISPAAQERLADLLDKNREDGLTADETAELDAYLRARDLLILLKANAQPEA